MDKTDVRYNHYLQVLHEELLPAMGCTEPIAIAYAAAKAREVLGAIPSEVLIEASGNIIKNVKSVVVPNTDGMKGMKAAAAAGIVAGRSELVLQVISQVTPEEREAIRRYLAQADIRTKAAGSDLVFDLIVTVRKDTSWVKIRIANYHTNIVLIESSGKTVFQKPLEESSGDQSDRSFMNVRDILDFAESVEIGEVREVIRRQIAMNMAISQEGMAGDYGANISRVLRKSPSYNLDPAVRAKAAAAAASDARMSGCELPVVVNSGSGNQGATVSIPVIVYAQELGVSEETMYRALVLSNLIAIHQKSQIGRLSAYCGAVSAGAAAGTGIAYLHGGRYEEITHTLVNALAITSGMICDGAKPSCAAKIALSVEAGILGFQMYQNGQQFYNGDGIVSCGVEETLKNVGRVGRDGMRSTDQEIIRIMTEE